MGPGALCSFRLQFVHMCKAKASKPKAKAKAEPGADCAQTSSGPKAKALADAVHFMHHAVKVSPLQMLQRAQDWKFGCLFLICPTCVQPLQLTWSCACMHASKLHISIYTCKVSIHAIDLYNLVYVVHVCDN